VETRRYYLSAELDWFEDAGLWEGLRTIGMVEAVRRNQRAEQRGTTLLFKQPAAGRENFRARGARPLGY
jgi:hypothetical protein